MRERPLFLAAVSRGPDMDRRWDLASRDWPRFRASLQRQWRRLTDADAERVRAGRAALIACIEDRYGYTPERAEQEVDAWLDDCNLD